MAINIYEARILSAMGIIQKAVKDEFGESKRTDEVIRLLAKVEDITVRPEAVETWEAMING